MKKGPWFEASLVPLINEFWPGSIRYQAQGTKDLGDLYMPGNRLYVVEAKNAARTDLPGWWKETQAEAMNAKTPFGVLVHKRRGKSDAEEQWATMTFGQWLRLVHRT